MEAEKLGSGLVNVVLGALILWVAQTTFQHSGELAGSDQRFDSLQTQHNGLRERLDGVMESINTRTRSRFTSEDGDKLAARIEEASEKVEAIERRLMDRVTELQLKLIAVQTQGVGHRELSSLRTDVERLHASLYPASARGPISVAERRSPPRDFSLPASR